MAFDGGNLRTVTLVAGDDACFRRRRVLTNGDALFVETANDLVPAQVVTGAHVVDGNVLWVMLADGTLRATGAGTVHCGIVGTLETRRCTGAVCSTLEELTGSLRSGHAVEGGDIVAWGHGAAGLGRVLEVDVAWLLGDFGFLRGLSTLALLAMVVLLRGKLVTLVVGVLAVLAVEQTRPTFGGGTTTRDAAEVVVLPDVASLASLARLDEGDVVDFVGLYSFERLFYGISVWTGCHLKFWEDCNTHIDLLRLEKIVVASFVVKALLRSIHLVTSTQDGTLGLVVLHGLKSLEGRRHATKPKT